MAYNWLPSPFCDGWSKYRLVLPLNIYWDCIMGSRGQWEFPLSWWRHQMEPFSALLALYAGNSPVPVNSLHKGQWRRALMFSFIYARINDWVNNPEAGDLRRQRGHYDVVTYFFFQMPLTFPLHSSNGRHLPSGLRKGLNCYAHLQETVCGLHTPNVLKYHRLNKGCHLLKSY